jgi:hypothetical protein
MKKLTIGALALTMLFCLVGGAAAVNTDLDDIQYYDPITGLPASPYAGQSVTVEGVVYVIPGIYNGGTHYIQGATGGINFFDMAAMPLVNGDRIQVTGQIGSYGGEINIGTDNITFLGNEAEPVPVDMAISAVQGEYETIGNLVKCIGTVTAKSSSDFYFTDGVDTLLVYIDSTTGISLGAVEVGDEYAVVSPVIVYNGLIELKPRTQGDLIEDPTGDTVPVIENVVAGNWTPEASDPIAIQATITDDSAISSAMVYYRDDSGDSTGVFLSVPMSNVGGDLYEGTIPAGHMYGQVDYYVSATDDGSQTSSNPGDAPAGWYELGVGFTSITDVQYAHPDSVYQGSSYNGDPVNIQGIVTAGTGDVSSPSKFYMQDGDGAWSGILVFESSSSHFVLPGDEVYVGGHILEYYGQTEMVPHDGTSIVAVSYDNDLPAVPIVAPAILADDEHTSVDGDPNTGEPWESVIVRTPISVVVDTVGSAQYNEFRIMEASAPNDTLGVNAIINLTYSADLADRVSVKGFMDYSYGEREIVPVRDEDVYLDLSTAVDETPVMPAGGFSAIAPNPFNPKTEIRFVMTRDNLAQLNVYNIRGELVTSLLNGRLQGGQEHIYTWNGSDSDGQQVASGTYFARLRIGTDVLQVRKLMLVK